MKLIINSAAYPCTGKPSFRDPVRFALPDAQPDPAALGDTITLTDNGGVTLKTITVADYARWCIDGTSLIGTNAPEETETEEPTETEPTADEDQNAMLVDHEYRITLIELGVSE